MDFATSCYSILNKARFRYIFVNEYVLEVRNASFTKHPVYTRSFPVYTWHHEMLCKRKLLEVGFINLQREVYQIGIRLSLVSHITSFREFHVNLSISREARFSRAYSETSFHQFSRLTCPESAPLMSRKGPPLERRSARNIRDRDGELRTDAKINRNDVESLLSLHFHLEGLTHLATRLAVFHI